MRTHEVPTNTLSSVFRRRCRPGPGRTAITTVAAAIAVASLLSAPAHASAQAFGGAVLDGTDLPTPPGDAIANMAVIERVFAAGGVAWPPQ